jgi:hypothetical protein
MSFLTELLERLQTPRRVTPSRDTDRSRPEAVLTKHAGRLMRMKGVLSVGVGRTDDGRPAIVLGLDSDAPEVLAALPTALDGVPVVRDRYGRTSAL